MQHPDEGMIHAWIDGALHAEAVRALEAHLATCEVCAQMAAEARGLVAASSRILTALDDVPANVIPAQPAATRPWSAPVKRFRQIPFWMRTAAAVVLLAGASGIVTRLNSPERKASTIAKLREETSMPAASLDSLTLDLAAAQASAPAPAPAMTPVRAKKAKQPAASVSLSAKSEKDLVATRALADLRTRDASATDRIAASEDKPTVVAQSTEPSPNLEKVAAAPPSSPMNGAIAGVLKRVDPSSAKGGSGYGQAAQAPTVGPRRSVPQSPAAVGAAAPAESRASFSDPGRVHATAGCYELALSPWSGGVIPFGAPPARIELDSLTSLDDEMRGYYLVHPARGTASNGAPFAYWRALGDTVLITWRNSQRGVELALPLDGDVARGRARTFELAPRGQPAQSSDVEARRISCR